MLENTLESLLNNIRQIEGAIVLEGINFTDYSTLKLVDCGTIVVVKDVMALKDAIDLIIKNKCKFSILGWGANQVLDPRILYVKLELPVDWEQLKVKQRVYKFPASASLPKLVAKACQMGLGGFEALGGIPASLGGAIAMNSGTNLGEIAPLVKRVEILNAYGEFVWIEVTPEDFSYRKFKKLGANEVIVSCELSPLEIFEDGLALTHKLNAYLSKRGATQPLRASTCGCTFKNASIQLRAGKLLDLLGLKGFCYQGLKVSHTHANFIEHQGGATCETFYLFCHMIRKEVKLQTGIDFEFEIVMPNFPSVDYPGSSC